MNSVLVNRLKHSYILLYILGYIFNYIGSNSAHDDPRDVLNGLCGSRCCEDRSSNCSVPFVDTFCYCDVTCLDRSPPDCCDDIFKSCRRQLLKTPSERKGEKITVSRKTKRVPNNCIHRGVRYTPGNKIKVNCNGCTCVYARLRNEYNWKCTQKQCLMSTVLIDYINEGAYGWRAQNQTVFWGIALKDGLQRKTGTFPPKPDVSNMAPVEEPHVDPMWDKFDSRDKWKGWIHGVMDQGDCASSWAFSTASVASDRMSIHSRGKVRNSLSPQHLLSCNSKKQDGCRGGNLDRAWWFMRKYGLVDATCYPYHSGFTGRKGKCYVPRLRRKWYTIVCPLYKDLRWATLKTSPPYRISQKEDDIKEEIRTNGPVQALLEVHEDFFVYKSGIYKHAVRDRVKRSLPDQYNFHSVKIIGWGVANTTNGQPVKYWLCANSWGENWGEEGYFRIVRGQNECQVESFVLGVWGKKPRKKKSKSKNRRNKSRRKNRDRKRRKGLSSKERNNIRVGLHW